MAYAIRPYADGDAEALSLVTLAAIATIGPAAYSQEQVAAWSARHIQPERIAGRVAAGDHIFVAVDNDDRPVAYVLLEKDGHVDMLYSHPDHSRLGLAGQLLAAAETKARTLGAARLYTEASELARPAFERAGYQMDERRDFTIEHGNRSVPIHNYAMTKGID
ncbi:GNAT family N-acetyltransferase [Erythrobacteraceae bacterium WH01K]|nr:GNAT family N-acetyltransferase [Erythrobacteraceae bacterium WH01K]